MPEPCVIRLELDQDRGVFTAGQEVSGRVRFRARESVKVAEARLDFLWQVNREKPLGRLAPEPVTERSELLVFNKEWSSGSFHDYTFRTTLPLGPFTYRGDAFDLGWEMAAVMLLEGGAEIRESRRFKLEPGPPESPCHLGPRPPVHVGRYRIGRPLKLEPGLPTLELGAPPSDDGQGRFAAVVAGLAAAVLGLFLFLSWEQNTTLVNVAGLAFLGFLGVALSRVWGRWAAERRLGSPTVIVRPETVPSNGALDCRIQMTPEKDTRMERLTAHLELQEWCLQEIKNKHGTTRVWRHHLVWSREELLAEGEDLVSGRRRRWEPTLELPDGAYPSFGGEADRLVWSVRVTAELKGAPDWSTREYVIVTP